MWTDNDGVWHIVDLSAVGLAIATFFGWLPNIAALLTVIWMVLRIYEAYLMIKQHRARLNKDGNDEPDAG